jgi:prevent-host-death family protein
MDLDHDTLGSVEKIAISEFKARCLQILERVRRTGRPILITRRGEPVAEIIPPSPTEQHDTWLGSAAGTGRIVEDIVAPASEEGDWEVLS